MGNPAVYPNEGRDIFVADVIAYIAFPQFHLLAPLADGVYQRVSGNEWEATVYLGVVNLEVLACLCLARARQRCLAVDLCSVRNGDVLHICQR